MKRFVLLFILLVSFILTACQSDETTKQERLSVSAAISLTDVLQDLAASFEKDENISLQLNFGGSGTLAQQIKQGAPVDLFISANPYWMDDLDKANEIYSATRANLASNELVLITSKHNEAHVKTLKELAKTTDPIAIGYPNSVPAGKYTQDALTNASLWTDIEEQLIQAKDVRQVLTYVETGEAMYGFVYASDVHQSEAVTIVETVDSDLHENLLYPAAITASSKEQELAQSFLTYLQSAEAQQIFKEYGFQPAIK